MHKRRGRPAPAYEHQGPESGDERHVQRVANGRCGWRRRGRRQFGGRELGSLRFDEVADVVGESELDEPAFDLAVEAHEQNDAESGDGKKPGRCAPRHC